MSDEADFGLVTPFVVCQSQGGVYDDTAFVAGWEAGAIDSALHVLAPMGGTLVRWVQPGLVAQLDLVAMKHGFNDHEQTRQAGALRGVEMSLWWDDIDVLLREVDRLRERIGEKDRERREAEERALDAERRLAGTRAKLVDANAAVSVLRKMFEDEWHRGGYFDIDSGVVDLHVDGLIEHERATLRRLRADVQQHPTDEGAADG